MLELIVELLGEFLLQVLIELGFHSCVEPFRRPSSPWMAAIGYIIFGTILGGVSLVVVPNNFVDKTRRIANLVATPIAVGGVMAAIGSWRARRGLTILRIDHFAYGYLFAFSVALVRFHFAT
nr:hypothetical protein [uncultured Desulfuromonas sp.]